MHVHLAPNERDAMRRASVSLPRLLHEQLSIWLNQAKSDSCMEVEARFGACAIGQQTWEAVTARLDELADTATVQDSTVKIYPDGVRESPPGAFVKKEKRTQVDLRDLGVRFAVSRETPVEKPTPPVSIVRSRHRRSFGLAGYEHLVFDCTRVVESPGNKESFELEMEFLASRASASSTNSVVISQFARGIYLILSVIQKSPWVITGPVRSRMVECYQRQFRSNSFIGAQPTSLHRKDVRRLRDGTYSVATKSDGERGLLFPGADGSMFVVDRKMAWRCIAAGEDVTTPQHYASTTVIDVEVLDDSLVAFDMLVDNGIDLRATTGTTSVGLSDRMRRVHAWLSTARHDLNIAPKEYVPYRWGMNRKLEDIMGKGDGLVFVPETEPYPGGTAWPSFFKWKPARCNSIDFVVIKDRDGRYVPHVHSDSGQVPFRVEDQVVHPVAEVVGFAGPMHGKIVECTFDSKAQHFLPLRIRTDKPRPNYCTVALDVWRSIRDAVEIKHLHIGWPEALRIHLNYVRNAQAHRTMRLSLATDCRKDPIRYLDVGGSNDGLRVAKARCNESAVSYHESVESLGGHAADVVQMHFQVEHHYASERSFEQLILSAKQHMTGDGVLSLIYMDGLGVVETSSWGRNACFSLTPGFDPRLFVESFDPSSDYNTTFSFLARARAKSRTERLHVVMPDALTLHLAELGFVLESTERYPNPINRSVVLSEEERDYNDLYRTATYRLSDIPQKRWTSLATSHGDGAVLSVVPGETVESILHMTTGIASHPGESPSALATLHSTVICITDQTSGHTDTMLPAHLASIERPVQISFVKGDDGQCHVVGFRSSLGPFPTAVHVVVPYHARPDATPTRPSHSAPHASRSSPHSSPSHQSPHASPHTDRTPQDGTPLETNVPHENDKTLLLLTSRGMGRTRGSWTVRELREFAAGNSVFSDLAVGGKKKQEIYDALVERLTGTTATTGKGKM